METYQPSPYEIVRTANMARNQAFLSKLDLISFKGTEPKAKSSATKRFFFEKAGRKCQRLQLAKDPKEKEYDEEKCGKCGETYYFVKGKNRKKM